MNREEALNMLRHSARELQFGSGSSAGGVFLGRPNNGNDNTTDGNSTSGNSTRTDLFISDVPGPTILYVLIGTVIIVMGLALSTYFCSFAFDRWCYFLPGFRRLDDETYANMDRGPVARRAQLWGLTKEERSLLLKHIFSSTTHAWDGPRSNETKDEMEGIAEQGNGNEKQENTVTVEATSQSIEEQEEEGDPAPNEEEGEEETTGVVASQQLAEGEQGPAVDVPLDDADHERLCCICLIEYERGCQVMTGTTCNHLFHASCAMEWLQSSHDHCPYCRKEMMTPTEYREAARAVLGEARVADFGRFTAIRRTVVDAPAEPDLEVGHVTSASEASGTEGPSVQGEDSLAEDTVSDAAIVEPPPREEIEMATLAETGSDGASVEEEHGRTVAADGEK